MVAVSILPYSYFLYESIYVRFKFYFLVLCHTLIFVGQVPLLFFNFIYLFLALLGLSLVAVSGGYSLMQCTASLVVEHEL